MKNFTLKSVQRRRKEVHSTQIFEDNKQ